MLLAMNFSCPTVKGRKKNLLRLGYKSYKEYLLSKQWKTTKIKISKERGNKCEECGKIGRRKKPLFVHHKTYKNVGEENAEELSLLCAECHKKEHFVVSVQKKNKVKFR